MISKITRSLLVLLACVAVAAAQDFRATITGQVKDPNGAAVPGATVKAVNLGTDEVKETRTTADGHYTLPYLNPGNYNIEVTARGFQTLKRESLVLRVADKLDLPLN